MNKEKIKKIQVPYELIINPDVPAYATYLYIHLKMICNNNHVRIYIEKFKSENYLNWKSTQTLKKYLTYLKNNNYIIYDFENLPKGKPLEIDILPITKDKMYVQLDVNIISKIQEFATKTEIIISKNNIKQLIISDCKEMAVRLYYFYVKNYNLEIGKSFPSYKEINEATGISLQYIKALNNMFKKNKLLKITIGKWYEQEDDDGFKYRKRERNSYIPIT